MATHLYFLILSLFLSVPIQAQEVSGDPEESDLLPGPLSEDLLQQKKENSYLTGVPAIAFSPDAGFVYGVVLFHFNNGERSDPRFAYTPYLRKSTLLAVQSTKGLSQVMLDFDLPNIASSLYRLKIETEFTRNISESYYGVGEETLEDTPLPGEVASEAGRATATSFTDHLEKIGEKRSDGSTYFRYNAYIQTLSSVAVTVERPFWSRHLIGGGGFLVSHTAVDDYSGDEVTAFENEKETTATMAETLLYEDQEAEKLIGYGGGAVNQLTASIRYDTRDFEPDPSSGVVSQATAAVSNESVGSTFDFSEFSLLQKAYLSPFKSLTIAGQAQYAWTEGTVPFFSLKGLGGRSSLKGHRINRFKSKAAANINVETRWRAAQVAGAGQTFNFVPIAFVDTGRVFDTPLRTSSEKWRRGGGTGLRIVWNQATVIGIEYALLGEEKSLYVNINHIF